MKLYLCGGGSGKQNLSALLKFSKKLDKTKPILYVPLAMEESKYDSCYKWFKEELKFMKLTKFEMVKSSLELSQKQLSNYSAIFIGGGNTYKLLSEIKCYSNYNKICDYLHSGGTIFGGSAGAISSARRAAVPRIRLLWRLPIPAPGLRRPVGMENGPGGRPAAPAGGATAAGAASHSLTGHLRLPLQNNPALP